jgi:hypothetical protein
MTTDRDPVIEYAIVAMQAKIEAAKAAKRAAGEVGK